MGRGRFIDMEVGENPDCDELPNLLIIGAHKCGTTSLHYYLGRHPEITMAAPRGHAAGVENDIAGKEMRFFWREDWRERLDWYRSHFRGMRTPIRGEATPAYSAYPYHPEVPERIHALIPHARLVYMVRDPIQRIVSQYIQERVSGDRHSFADYMRECEEPANRIVCPSRYATQVERYLRLFRDSQLLVIDQHDLRHRRRATLRRLFAFLGVDQEFWSRSFELELNTRAAKHVLGRRRAVLFDHVIDPAGRRLARGKWPRIGTNLRRALADDGVEEPLVSSEMRERLAMQLAPEAERLRDLTGEPFASWSL